MTEKHSNTFLAAMIEGYELQPVDLIWAKRDAADAGDAEAAAWLRKWYDVIDKAPKSSAGPDRLRSMFQIS